MEFIKLIRGNRKERKQAKKLNDLQRLAEETIEVKDFSDGLYFAYNGVPYVPIDSSWTSVEIVKELALLRENFVNVKIKQNGIIRVAAF